MSNIKHKLGRQDSSHEKLGFRLYLSKSQYKLLVGQFVKDVWKDRSIATIDKHLSSEFVDHNSWQGSPQNLESWKIGFIHFCDTFSGYKFSLEKIVSEGDIVSIKYSIIIGVNQHGSSKNELNSDYITISGVDMYRIAKGKIVERWGLDLNYTITGAQRK